MYDPNIKRSGTYSGRYEVRSTDIVLLGNRCELIGPIGQNGEMFEDDTSGTQYFAWSTRFDDDWIAPTSNIILQLHGPASLGVSPSIRVDGSDKISVYLHGGDLDGTYINNQQYLVSNDALNRGHWIDFVMRVKFAVTYTGELELFRRDEGETDFTSILSLTNVPTLQYKSSLGGVGGHYWQLGLYRGQWHWFTDVLWQSGFTRGDDFNAVIAKAWGA